MKKSFLFCLLFMCVSIMAQDSNFHIYLCFGQSNMYGSAKIEEQDQQAPERLKMLATTSSEEKGRVLGEWYVAHPPLSHHYAGLSPADYFGRTMLASAPKDVTIGLINVAIGGCDIRIFDKNIYTQYLDTYKEDWFQNIVADYGGAPYDRLVEMAKIAQKSGVIKGIILHQGETNTGDKQWPAYVNAVYTNLLNDLGLNASDVPLLAGEVVHENQKGTCSAMNPIIRTLPETIPTAYVISSDGCEVAEDFVHFNSAGVRELGKRYAEKMLEVTK